MESPFLALWRLWEEEEKGRGEVLDVGSMLQRSGGGLRISTEPVTCCPVRPKQVLPGLGEAYRVASSNMTQGEGQQP